MVATNQKSRSGKKRYISAYSQGRNEILKGSPEVLAVKIQGARGHI